MDVTRHHHEIVGSNVFKMFMAAVLLLAALALLPAQSGATTLHVWIIDQNAQTIQALENEWIPSFEAANPGSKVTYEIVGWGALSDKLPVAIAAGVAPDVFQAGAEFRAVMAENGLARPIDDFLADWPEWEDFIPGVWQTVVWNGKTYGVPYLTSPRSIVYNEAHFAESGLPSTPPGTWEDFRSVALRLNRADSDGMLQRVGIEAHSLSRGLHFVLPFFLQNGVSMLSEDGTRATFATPAGVEALEYIVDFTRAVNPPDRLGIVRRDISQNFVDGVSSMLYTGVGIFGWARQVDPIMAEGIRVAPPLTRKEQAAVTYSDWWAISTTSAAPELAFEWIKHVSEPERLEVYNETLGTIPPRNAVIGSGWLVDNPDKALFAELVLPYANPYYSSRHADRLINFFFTALAQALDVMVPPTEALQSAADKYNALFQ